MKMYLGESKSLEVDIEELEDLVGPDDIDLDFRRILEEARDEKGSAISETFSTDGQSEFVVVSRSRWTRTKGSGTHHGDKFRLRVQVMDGGKRAWKTESWMELGGKKGFGCSGRPPGKLRPHESGHLGLGALDGARKPRDLSKVHL